MTGTQERLLQQARKRCGTIEPCSGRNWEGCFSVIGGMLILWFNTPDGNTHIERENALEGGKALEAGRRVGRA